MLHDHLKQVCNSSTILGEVFGNLKIEHIDELHSQSDTGRGTTSKQEQIRFEDVSAAHGVDTSAKGDRNKSAESETSRQMTRCDATANASARASPKFQANSILVGRAKLTDDLLTFESLYATSGRRSSLRFNFEANRMEIAFDHHSLNIDFGAIRGTINCINQGKYDRIIFFSRSPPRIFHFSRRLVSAEERGDTDGDQSAHFKTVFNRVTQLSSTATRILQTRISLYREAASFQIGRCNAYHVLLISDWNVHEQLMASLKILEERNMKVAIVSESQVVLRDSRNLFATVGNTYHNRTIKLPFEARYLLEAAVSSNCLDDLHIDDFVGLLETIEPRFAVDILLQVVHSGQPLESVKTAFDKLYRSVSRTLPTKEILPDYCVKLRKVLVTPTTLVIQAPNIEMSNRVLRQYTSHLDRFLRVQFCDEIGYGRLHPKEGMDDLYDRVFDTLSKGIYIAGRLYKFLAFGNSQLREHGAFFFSDCGGSADCGDSLCKGLAARDIRENIGDVSGIQIIAKQTARVGQAFSTTRATRSSMSGLKVEEILDFVGGIKDEYNFSDGVGMTSERVLQEVSKEMGYAGLACSAVQFRFGGAKGVLAQANPRGILTKAGIRRTVQEDEVCLRPSQQKFRSEHTGLEIVRLAKYGAAFLNRQYITTLWSLGVTTPIFISMQRKMIEELDLSLTNRKVALKCLRRFVDEHGSTLFLEELVSFGFMGRGDPFVNHVLRLFRKWSLRLLKEKAKINVEKGCFLMGVTDETRTLRGHFHSYYDQDDTDLEAMTLPEVFLQITDPEHPTQMKVIQDICMVCRAPTLHPGDIRLVRAVDKPELRYLRNVLVFPSTGDQDLPSMCSGGDLDGDDYTIIWDRSLFPAVGHRYERAMSYVGPKPKISPVITLKHVFEFMVDFMKNDALGQIANAHLAFAHDAVATRNGAENQPDCRAFSDECMILADLHSTAVDFAKTGVAATMPAHLRRKTFPDFMEKPGCQSYISDSPLSHMYRDAVQTAPSVDSKASYDNTLCDVPGMIDWIDFAREQKAAYDKTMRRIMKQYEIDDEAEIVTGFLLSYDERRAHKREHQARVDIAGQYNAVKEMFRRQIDAVAYEDGKDKAIADARKDAIVAAMYDVTFTEILSRPGERVMMSFPWIFHQVLGRLSGQREERKANHSS